MNYSPLFLFLLSMYTMLQSECFALRLVKQIVPPIAFISRGFGRGVEIASTRSDKSQLGLAVGGRGFIFTYSVSAFYSYGVIDETGVYNFKDGTQVMSSFFVDSPFIASRFLGHPVSTQVENINLPDAATSTAVYINSLDGVATPLITNIGPGNKIPILTRGVQNTDDFGRLLAFDRTVHSLEQTNRILVAGNRAAYVFSATVLGDGQSFKLEQYTNGITVNPEDVIAGRVLEDIAFYGDRLALCGSGQIRIYDQQGDNSFLKTLTIQVHSSVCCVLHNRKILAYTDVTGLYVYDLDRQRIVDNHSTPVGTFSSLATIDVSISDGFDEPIPVFFVGNAERSEVLILDLLIPPTPSPSPSPFPSPSNSPSSSLTPSESWSPEPTASPGVIITLSAAPLITPSPSPSSSPSNSPSPTPTKTPTPSPSSTPSPISTQPLRDVGIIAATFQSTFVGVCDPLTTLQIIPRSSFTGAANQTLRLNGIVCDKTIEITYSSGSSQGSFSRYGYDIQLVMRDGYWNLVVKADDACNPLDVPYRIQANTDLRMIVNDESPQTEGATWFIGLAFECIHSNSPLQFIPMTPTPTPSPVFTPGSDPTASLGPSPPLEPGAPVTCFPGDALVELESGEMITMYRLKIGDKVRSSATEFSTVYFFSHRLPDQESEFFDIVVERNLTLTASYVHMVYANDKVVMVGNLQKGDLLMLKDGSHSAVTTITKVIRRGIYSPTTLTGNIYVNGIRATCYTGIIPPVVAHALCTPVRLVYQYFGINIFGNWLDGGAPRLAGLLRRILCKSC